VTAPAAVSAALKAPAAAAEDLPGTPIEAGRAGRVMTSPANRRRAREAGIDLSSVAGSGPGGRILRSDLNSTGVGAAVSQAANVAPTAAATSEIKVIGVRRLIAERMSAAKRDIPHFAYVEEVDVTELEALRAQMNAKLVKGEPGLTYLPLVISALVRVLESFPQCNVLYDAARGVLVRHRAVHVGIATQTPDGLKVPVLRNAQALGLWEIAAEARRVSERARSNKATRDELVGSTITITSLGKLGGIASTPVINAPEVAIVGLNKAVDRPVVHQGAIAVRRIMNLSSSFDHRFVDGYDAAAMIQALKELLEHPAMIFILKAKSP
jgi:2-oxoisovalerate dehydrogenase E2 component (dihydrolipoyl transacylase)